MDTTRRNSRILRWGVQAFIWGGLFCLTSGSLLPVQAGGKNLRANLQVQDNCTQCAPIITRRALQMNGGRIEGNVQQLTADSVNINSGSTFIGNLLVPGNPNITDNSSTVDAASIISFGCSTTNTNSYNISLNGEINWSGQIIKRSTPMTLASLAPIPMPTANGNVTLNTLAEASAFNSNPSNTNNLRNLVLNAGVGSVEVGPGTYGTFGANDRTELVLGTNSSTVDNPAVYNFQDLYLNTGSQLVIRGYVKLRVQNQLVLASNSTFGCKMETLSTGGGPTVEESNLVFNEANATFDGADAISDFQRLQVELAGNLSLNSNSVFCGNLNVPNRSVSVSPYATFMGSLKCDQLMVNSSATVKGFCPTP
jgi:cytoskeletal protein CcmA (bactofilin family)